MRVLIRKETQTTVKDNKHMKKQTKKNDKKHNKTKQTKTTI